jgi:hypothetical protein
MNCIYFRRMKRAKRYTFPYDCTECNQKTFSNVRRDTPSDGCGLPVQGTSTVRGPLHTGDTKLQSTKEQHQFPIP